MVGTLNWRLAVDSPWISYEKPGVCRLQTPSFSQGFQTSSFQRFKGLDSSVSSQVWVFEPDMHPTCTFKGSYPVSTSASSVCWAQKAMGAKISKKLPKRHFASKNPVIVDNIRAINKTYYRMACLNQMGESVMFCDSTAWLNCQALKLFFVERPNCWLNKIQLTMVGLVILPKKICNCRFLFFFWRICQTMRCFKFPLVIPVPRG